jgi:hypothetical protein
MLYLGPKCVERGVLAARLTCSSSGTCFSMQILKQSCRRLSFYAFVQRDQHWKELLKALKSFDTGGAQANTGDLHSSSMSASNNQRANGGVDRSDMESALQRLLALNLVTQGNVDV